jgi:hypothetical protein
MKITIPWLKQRNGAPPALKPQTTHHGWPLGKALDVPAGWQVIMHPLAHAKLETWHKGSNGLEVSGKAILDRPVKADPAQPYTFYVIDILLGCAIQESTGGYTEMPPDIQARLMTQVLQAGHKANATGWWHKHPVTGWSGTDIDTMRQRVHETGLDKREKLQAFAFVLTPHGIRARWDQSGPKEEDNIYVDQIPVMIGTPDMGEAIAAAQAEIDALMAQRKDKPVSSAPIEMPQVSWRRTVTPDPFGCYADMLAEEAYWEDMYALEELVITNLVGLRLAANEDPAEFVCRKDPATLVGTEWCASCPFSMDCFAISQADYNQELRKLTEEPT